MFTILRLGEAQLTPSGALSRFPAARYGDALAHVLLRSCPVLEGAKSDSRDTATHGGRAMVVSVVISLVAGYPPCKAVDNHSMGKQLGGC